MQSFSRAHLVELEVWVESQLGETTANPIEAIKFEMERRGLTVKDLVSMIGGTNRIYEILNRKRPLSLKMIWRLHKTLGIPAESLIRPMDDQFAV